MITNKTSLLLVTLLLGCSAAAFAAPTPSQEAEFNKSGLNNAGVAANRTIEYMERQRVARQIAEDKAKASSKVEQGSQKPDAEQQAAVTFKLEKLELDESTVLEQAELQKLTDEYIGKEVGVKDLYELVNKINKLYLDNGYFTCRAILPAQTIKNGTVKIELIEGKTNAVEVQGNKYTKSKYISKRMSLKQGEVANINKLNDDLLRFNAANDVQLRISLQAGSEPGTTDYVISAYEPQNITWTVYSDNAGSDTSGEYRGGLFFTDGILEPLNVRGHAYAMNVGLSQLLVATEKIRTEATLDYGQQNSKTDFSGQHWLDDIIKGVTAGYSVTNYGASSVIYQKHSFNAGTHTDIADNDKDFSLYQLNGLYQKMYQHGQLLSLRLDAQRGFNNYLPSARQFYIGGMYSVRGYKESLLGGDSGYSVGLEYSVPVTKDKKTSAFAFMDHGQVFGDSAFDSHVLTSCGLGVRSNITKHIGAVVTLGVPLIKEINNTDVDSTRIHFMVSGQF